MKSLSATEQIRTINIEGNKFVFGVPNNWHFEKGKKPIDYKLKHQDGDRECYLCFDCYSDPIPKDELFYRQIELLTELFGDKFLDQSNFSPLMFSEDLDDVTWWCFLWKTGTELELVFAISNKSYGDKSCCSNFLFIQKLESEDFDLDKIITSLIRDYGHLRLNVGFFPRERPSSWW